MHFCAYTLYATSWFIEIEKIQSANPNLSVLEEYRQREEEYAMRAKDLEEASARSDAAKQKYEELRDLRFDEFMRGFTCISQKLKEMYQVGNIIWHWRQHNK